jgi:glycosyltransferase involved in cell wall biosynthesis
VKREILSKLGYDLESKIELVPLSTTRKHFIKSYNHDKVRILFIGSAYGPQSNDFFWLKGGREVFKVFEILNKEYRNLELVVRSVVPPEIKRRYQRYPNVRIIDYIIPREKLEFEFKRADIFLFPGHHTPFGVILEAMSYELPVVVIDNCWANSELIEDGVTGFVVDSPMLRLFRERGYAQLPVSSFLKLIRTPDPELVKKLSQKIGLLIQDENLRKKMGRNARREVEVGRYSIAHRNMILKKIFDEITE